ncbi:hypothetical protein IFM89_026408 [Coptis chinensis]|uniref:RING-type E3 ubiquitin transferase n=1 Tax=Coptis chinensis TaxID=261450 RepID=A0A835LWS1_9MAGN|nr:hypothetical protein IFM89_026408 [Coptis chinensis]
MATDVLEDEIKKAKQLVDECSKRSRVYLLVNCRKIVKRLEDSTRKISKALLLIPLASLDLSYGIKEKMNNLCEDMLNAKFTTAMAEEGILEKIEMGIQERNVNRSYANELLFRIADALGISTERAALKKVYDDFKNEIDDVHSRKDQAEAIQMDQIIALLGRADAASSAKEKEIKYINRRNSLVSQPMEPLETFYCTITGDVMVDPVDTSSGQTFERSAIEKWLADGNNLCPLTQTPLNPAILRPNKALRQSIEEWKDRNTIITLASIKPSFQSNDEHEVLRSLGQLQDICEEKDLHLEWVAHEDYIPLLIKLLGAKNREIKQKALVILSILAKDSDDTKSVCGCGGGGSASNRDNVFDHRAMAIFWTTLSSEPAYPSRLYHGWVEHSVQISDLGACRLNNLLGTNCPTFQKLEFLRIMKLKPDGTFSKERACFGGLFCRIGGSVVVAFTAQDLSGVEEDVSCGAKFTLHEFIDMERIANVEDAIESIVRALGRREGKLAVALLLELSKNAAICERIGKPLDCIYFLVVMSSNDDVEASRDANELLENLALLDQNIAQMAKANYFKPLLQRLSSGLENVKLLAATTLAEMELTDHNKAALVEEGVLGPLLYLVSQGDTEMKKVALKALKNLSSLPTNGLQMIREGAVVSLLGLLYHRSLSAPGLREEAAATIMNLSLSTKAHEAGQTQVVLLEDDDDICKLFSLVNLAEPNVQKSILHAFKDMCQPPSAKDMRSKLRQCSAVEVLVKLCEINDITVRADAVKLFYCLTQDDDDGTLSEYIDQSCITNLLNIINNSIDEEEIAATMDGNNTGLYKNQLIEGAVGSLCRFSVSTNQEWQNRLAECIPVLVQWLVKGSTLTKERVAVSLKQFSKNSTRLSRPIEQRRGFWCCSAPSETGCPVHMGICTVESSFCLVEADAVKPLVGLLGEPDVGPCRASLEALLTLIDGEKPESGSKLLGEANAITPMIRLLSSHSFQLQEMALHALEMIFRVEEFKKKYGASAQIHLIDITQRGNSTARPLAARILAHLNVLHQQSSYF